MNTSAPGAAAVANDGGGDDGDGSGSDGGGDDGVVMTSYRLWCSVSTHARYRPRRDFRRVWT